MSSSAFVGSGGDGVDPDPRTGFGQERLAWLGRPRTLLRGRRNRDVPVACVKTFIENRRRTLRCQRHPTTSRWRARHGFPRRAACTPAARPDRMPLESAPPRARASSRARSTPHPAKRRRRALGKGLALSILVGALGIAASLHGVARSSASGLAGTAAPLNDLGEAESADLPARCAGFEVRRGGAWTHPGAQAFRGDPYCAIVATGIPEPHASRLAEDIRRGDAVGTVEISARGVHGAGRQFADRMDMSYGNGMSLGQRVGFPESRIERGLLFQRAGYWVAVPDVCGNVTRLYPRLADAPQAAVGPPLDGSIGDPPAGPGAPQAGEPGPIGQAAPKYLGSSAFPGWPGPGVPAAPAGPSGASSPADAAGPAWPGGPAPSLAGPALAEAPTQVALQAVDPAGSPGRSGLDAPVDPQDTGPVLREPAPTPVPEPDSLLCVLAGGMALTGVLVRRRRDARRPAPGCPPSPSPGRNPRR